MAKISKAEAYAERFRCPTFTTKSNWDQGSVPVAHVDKDGDLRLVRKCWLTKSEALRLARWLTETFEPREEAP